MKKVIKKKFDYEKRDVNHISWGAPATEIPYKRSETPAQEAKDSAAHEAKESSAKEQKEHASSPAAAGASSFGQAFKTAYAGGKGRGQTFTYKGKKYAAVTKEDVNKSGQKSLGGYLKAKGAPAKPNIVKVTPPPVPGATPSPLEGRTSQTSYTPTHGTPTGSQSALSKASGVVAATAATASAAAGVYGVAKIAKGLFSRKRGTSAALAAVPKLLTAGRIPPARQITAGRGGVMLPEGGRMLPGDVGRGEIAVRRGELGRPTHEGLLSRPSPKQNLAALARRTVPWQKQAAVAVDKVVGGLKAPSWQASLAKAVDKTTNSLNASRPKAATVNSGQNTSNPGNAVKLSIQNPEVTIEGVKPSTGGVAQAPSGKPAKVGSKPVITTKKAAPVKTGGDTAVKVTDIPAPAQKPTVKVTSAPVVAPSTATIAPEVTGQAVKVLGPPLGSPERLDKLLGIKRKPKTSATAAPAPISATGGNAVKLDLGGAAETPVKPQEGNRILSGGTQVVSKPAAEVKPTGATRAIRRRKGVETNIVTHDDQPAARTAKPVQPTGVQKTPTITPPAPPTPQATKQKTGVSSETLKQFGYDDRQIARMSETSKYTVLKDKVHASTASVSPYGELRLLKAKPAEAPKASASVAPTPTGNAPAPTPKASPPTIMEQVTQNAANRGAKWAKDKLAKTEHQTAARAVGESTVETNSRAVKLDLSSTETPSVALNPNVHGTPTQTSKPAKKGQKAKVKPAATPTAPPAQGDIFSELNKDFDETARGARAAKAADVAAARVSRETGPLSFSSNTAKITEAEQRKAQIEAHMKKRGYKLVSPVGDVKAVTAQAARKLPSAAESFGAGARKVVGSFGRYAGRLRGTASHMSRYGLPLAIATGVGTLAAQESKAEGSNRTEQMAAAAGGVAGTAAGFAPWIIAEKVAAKAALQKGAVGLAGKAAARYLIPGAGTALMAYDTATVSAPLIRDAAKAGYGWFSAAREAKKEAAGSAEKYGTIEKATATRRKVRRITNA